MTPETHQEAQQETRSTCPYCGTGCGVVISHSAGRITGVRGDPDHPANFGKLCTKGANLHRTVQLDGRLVQPLWREQRAAPLQALGWDEALDQAARRFAETIREHGPDAVAFYISGQLLTEDYYVFNKLARALVGTNNIDSNSRLCMSSAVAGYKATLGMDSVPCCYEDIDLADLLFISGANTAFAHPILFRRIEAAREARPDLKIVVVDPRRTDTAAMADLHLQIAPGTDLYLFAAMLQVLATEGLVDAAYIADHTEGYAALLEQLGSVTPEVAAGVCQVPAADIVQAARWFGQAAAPLSFWCQGLNQSGHGTANSAALIHLHLATGKIGRPGMGPFSLTGQPNAMGGREVGAMANLLSAHRDLKNPADRAEMADFWGIPAIPAQPGLMAVQLFEAVRRGEIKALWIACTNPAHSLPDQQRVREALAACPFVVVQDAFADTDTCSHADLLLPAATWGEKDGTVTNSERRITRVRAAVAAPGEARADWRIARDFALALGRRLDRPDAARLFDFPSPAAVFAEHARSTRGRDLDIAGLDYARLEQGAVQWPYDVAQASGKARLYSDGVFPTASGRARFAPIELRLNGEAPDAAYPLRLNTGRLRDQWHGMSRTGRSGRLYAHEAEARLQMHPDDMAQRGLADGDLVRLSSRRGATVLPVAASDELAPGGVYLAMHWGSANLSHPGANLHTLQELDPVSGQPALKHAAVQITPVSLPWQLVIVRACPGLDEAAAGERLLAWRRQLAPLLADQPYASLTLGGRESPVLILRLARAQALAQAEIERLAELLELPAERCRVLSDPARRIEKRARFEDVGTVRRLAGILFAGETAALPWLLEHMTGGDAIGGLDPWIFLPSATPPAGGEGRGRIVCNCLNVSENEIHAGIAAGQRSLEQLKATLKCGTACGSCVPEVRRMLAASEVAA